MGKLPLDESTLEKLREVKQRVEVCDLEGRIVGYFEPSRYAGYVVPDIDDDEIDKRMAEYREKGGYTTAQVLDHLRKLGGR